MLFRRNKSETPAADVPDKEGGKGRPTRSRREAEAERKAAAKTPRTRREMAAAQRKARSETSGKMREAMRTGDDRYLPPRDRGPVRRFVRDFVDVRLSYVEFLIPLLLLTIVLGYAGATTAAGYANSAMFALLLLMVFTIWRTVRAMKKELAARFPDQDTSRTTWYAVSRMLQMKFMRLPKSQVKIGQELPEHYR